MRKKKRWVTSSWFWYFLCVSCHLRLRRIVILIVIACRSYPATYRASWHKALSYPNRIGSTAIYGENHSPLSDSMEEMTISSWFERACHLASSVVIRSFVLHWILNVCRTIQSNQNRLPEYVYSLASQQSIQKKWEWMMKWKKHIVSVPIISFCRYRWILNFSI